MSGGLNYIWRVQLAFPGWLACGFGHKPIGIGLFLPQIAWETSGWQGSKHLESHAPRFDLYTFGYLLGLGWLKTTFCIILRTLSPSQFIFSELPPPRQSFIFEAWVGNFF